MTPPKPDPTDSKYLGPSLVRLGVTIGDPGGIGPEVALKAIASAAATHHTPIPERDTLDVQYTLIGPRRLWQYHVDLLAQSHPRDAAFYRDLLDALPIIDTPDPGSGSPPEIGATGPRHGVVALGAIGSAVEAALNDRIDAIVTAPVSKDGLAAGGSQHPGHTEILCELTGSKDSTMLLAGGGLRVALVTIHVALSQVPDLLTKELVIRKATHLREHLLLLGIEDPRITVCGLNPHAGENGLFGREEIEIIAPAVEEMRARGWTMEGPLPADTVFVNMLDSRADGILAMYHDQGLIPVKTLAFESAVNITLGLPIVRTSPDHGTAFGIAGRGIASHASMESALRQAEDIVRRRRAARGVR
jgi:4-hydroxythreonine-4-phosphate dehydrogenase